MKVKTKVHKYRRNDGTPVRTHTRKIDVDVFKPERQDNIFENKDDSPSIEIDNNLIKRKKKSFKILEDEELLFNKHRKELAEEAISEIKHEIDNSHSMKEEDIVNIKLFGSFTTKKKKPEDIDVAVFVKNKKDFSSLQDANPNVDILWLSDDKFGHDKFFEKQKYNF